MRFNLEAVKQQYGIVGNDYKLNMAIENAVKAAPTNLSILVTGESGVGKDIFARLIHEKSNRGQKRLVAVNCGAIPEGTIESELFGHVKGAFTGAEKDRNGYFKEADGGTIFLDEVGELPLIVQVKLLRVLQNGEIIRVGESKPQKVDVRVVAATNTNVEEAVRAGRFRPDLYYRLNQMAIFIPPLRERQPDIPMLFSRFAADIAVESGMRAIMLADDEAREYLMHYPWYGNVRELRSITQRIAYLEPERLITRQILQNYLPPASNGALPATYVETPNYVSDRELLMKALSLGQMITELRKELFDLRQTVEQIREGSAVGHTTPVLPVSHIDERGGGLRLISSSETHSPELKPVSDDDCPPVETVAVPVEVALDEPPLSLPERERQAIIRALELHKGNRKLAAQALKVSERTLYRKIKNYNI